MSKLFNTLEKISRNESVKVSTGVASKAAKPRIKFEKHQGAGIVILVVGLIILAYLLVPKSTNHKSTTQPVTPETAAQNTTEMTTPQISAPLTAESPAASQEKVTNSESTPGNEREFASLVNQGAELIEKRDYWRGLYLLNKANELQPDRLEPLVNSVVALAELGHRELAVSYLNKAEKLAPGHPALQENRLILSQAGVEEVNNH